MPCLPTSRERPFAQAWTAAFAEKAALRSSGSRLPGDVDDATPAPLDHAGEDRVGELAGRREVERHRLDPFLLGRVDRQRPTPPAELTRISTRAERRQRRIASRCGASSSMTSCDDDAGGRAARPPRSRRRASRGARAAARQRRGGRLRRASAAAMARPIPMLAPVTRAACPRSWSSMSPRSPLGPTPRPRAADGRASASAASRPGWSRGRCRSGGAVRRSIAPSAARLPVRRRRPGCAVIAVSVVLSAQMCRSCTSTTPGSPSR